MQEIQYHLTEAFIIARAAHNGEWGYYRGPHAHPPTSFQGNITTAYRYASYGEAQTELLKLPGRFFKIDKIFIKGETVSA